MVSALHVPTPTGCGVHTNSGAQLVVERELLHPVSTCVVLLVEHPQAVHSDSALDNRVVERCELHPVVVRRTGRD